MSKKSHNAVSMSVEIFHKTSEQLEREYGIEIYEDGVVYDPCSDEEFDSLSEWAAYIDDIDDAVDTFIKNGHKSKYDDEY